MGKDIKTFQAKLREKTGSIAWEGKSQQGKDMPIGIYIIKLEYKIGSQIYEEKKSTILAKKL